MITKEEKRKIGKKSRASGAAFERRVRKDLENKNWIVDKWTNNVEPDKREECLLDQDPMNKINVYEGKLVPAKPKSVFINGQMRIINMWTGFPDFIAFKIARGYMKEFYENIGVESKSNGILTKEEKLKCKFYLDNNIFSSILIAQKGKKKGEIIFKEFKCMAK